MKKLLLLLAVVCLAGSAQTRKPNFSGTWELVLAKSDFGRIPPPKKVTSVVTHREPFIKVNSTLVADRGEFEAELIYRTTKAEDMNESHGAIMLTQSYWDEQVLVTEGQVHAKGAAATFKERWRLADAGKTWINDRVLTTGDGDVVQKLVFVKK